MKTNETMIAGFNKQLSLEAYASQLYLSMASWLNFKGYSGCAKFMHAQAAEERMHMMKIYEYLDEIGAMAVTPEIKKPPQDFDNIVNLFEMVYDHERKVTESIFSLRNLAEGENDYTSEVFLEWYIEEQREEENTMRTIMDRIQLIGEGPHRDYFIDLEVEKMCNAAGN